MSARILVIEDNAANRELMTYLIRAFGYEVDTATDGKEGIQAALQAPPDLLICDLQLPGISGFDVIERLRSASGTKYIPIIAVTAYAMVGDRDKILAAGFDGYISKPIDPETFVKEIEGFLPLDKKPSLIPETQPPAPRVDPIQEPTSALVLVVDDSPSTLSSTKKTLELSGYRVIAAETADAAVKLTRHYAFDLILSQLPMTRDHALEFLRRVKTNAVLRSIPFLLCNSTTTEPAEDLLRRAAQSGAERIVPRPVSAKRLLEEVAACLKGEKHTIQSEGAEA